MHGDRQRRFGCGPATDESFSLSTNVPAGTETSNAETNSRTISDAAGNTATAGPVAGNKVDKKGPQVSCDAADGAWHSADVSIACTASGRRLWCRSGDRRELQPAHGRAGRDRDRERIDRQPDDQRRGRQHEHGRPRGRQQGRQEGAAGVLRRGGRCLARDGREHRLHRYGRRFRRVSPATDESFSLHTDVPAGTETDDAADEQPDDQRRGRQHRDGGPGGRQQGGQEGPGRVVRRGGRCVARDGREHRRARRATPARVSQRPARELQPVDERAGRDRDRRR